MEAEEWVTQAITRFQACVRGYLWRSSLQDEFEALLAELEESEQRNQATAEPEEAATSIQRIWRDHRARRELAAVFTLQRFYRRVVRSAIWARENTATEPWVHGDAREAVEAVIDGLLPDVFHLVPVRHVCAIKFKAGEAMSWAFAPIRPQTSIVRSVGRMQTRLFDRRRMRKSVQRTMDVLQPRGLAKYDSQMEYTPSLAHGNSRQHALFRVAMVKQQVSARLQMSLFSMLNRKLRRTPQCQGWVWERTHVYRQMAACQIQCLWRGYRTRCIAVPILQLRVVAMRAVLCIQRAWRFFVGVRSRLRMLRCISEYSSWCGTKSDSVLLEAQLYFKLFYCSCQRTAIRESGRGRYPEYGVIYSVSNDGLLYCCPKPWQSITQRCGVPRWAAWHIPMEDVSTVPHPDSRVQHADVLASIRRLLSLGATAAIVCHPQLSSVCDRGLSRRSDDLYVQIRYVSAEEARRRVAALMLLTFDPLRGRSLKLLPRHIVEDARQPVAILRKCDMRVPAWLAFPIPTGSSQLRYQIMLEQLSPDVSPVMLIDQCQQAEPAIAEQKESEHQQIQALHQTDGRGAGTCPAWALTAQPATFTLLLKQSTSSVKRTTALQQRLDRLRANKAAKLRVEQQARDDEQHYLRSTGSRRATTANETATLHHTHRLQLAETQRQEELRQRRSMKRQISALLRARKAEAELQVFATTQARRQEEVFHAEAIAEQQLVAMCVRRLQAVVDKQEATRKWYKRQIRDGKVVRRMTGKVIGYLNSAGEVAARRSFAQRFATRLAVLETKTSRRAHSRHGQRPSKPRPAPPHAVRPLFAPASRSAAAAVVQGDKHSPAIAISTPRSKQQPGHAGQTRSVDTWQLSPRHARRSEISSSSSSSKDRQTPITRISVQPHFTHDRSLPPPPPIPLPSPPATPQRRRPTTPTPGRRFKRKLHIDKVYVPVAALLLEESTAQHSTAQHSIAQHSTAQHSTA